MNCTQKGVENNVIMLTVAICAVCFGVWQHSIAAAVFALAALRLQFWTHGR